jgi:hypothetical protein
MAKTARHNTPHFATRTHPPSGAFVRSLVAGLVPFVIRIVVVHQDCQAIDATEHGKSADRASKPERPCGPEPKRHAGKDCLDTLPDVEAAFDLIMPAKLDGSAGNRSQSHAVDLPTIRIERRSMDSDRLIGSDRAE